MAVRLCNENLSKVPGFFSVPGYNRADVKSTILHIGPSGFSRSHIIPFADDLNEKQHRAGQRPTHGVIAVSMRHADVYDDLAPQDFLYTLTSKGKGLTEYRVVKSLMDVLVAPQNPQLIVETAASPDIEVISLTVTQAGYYFSANKDEHVNFDAPEIKADLENSLEATSSIGLIAAALDLRRQRGILPPTILSCDNLKHNGTRLRNAVIAFAQKKSPDLAAWIEKNVAFPNTMVDRITPGKSAKQISAVAALGVLDNRPVEAEPLPGMPFVIEGVVSKDPATGEPVNFPDFASVGAIITKEVAPYESLKLGTVNGAHMALGCAGHVLGEAFADEAMHKEPLRSFIKGFMAEVGQTLSHTEGVDQNQYRHDVERRIDNDQMKDPLTRLARNGSEDKVKSRLAEPLHDALKNPSLKHEHLAFAFASWIQYLKTLDKDGYLKGVKYYDETGRSIDPETCTRETVRYIKNDDKLVKADPNDKKAADIGLLDGTHIKADTVDVGPLFSLSKLDLNGLGKHPHAQSVINKQLVAIHEKGFAQALADFVDEHPGAFLQEDNDNNGGQPDIDPAQHAMPALQPR